MRSLKIVTTCCTLLLCAIIGFGQGDLKHFMKDGLLFDYPSSWQMTDGSNADAQQFQFNRADSDVQMSVFVFRSKATKPEQMAEAKKVLVDPYVNSTAKQLEQMGAKPERVAATSEIGGGAAEGVKLKAVLSGEPGAAEVYWEFVGQRLVVLTIFGPDKARQQATAAWDTLRNSIKVEEPAAAPAPKPTPKPN
jgi:hypothetical protein